MCYNAYLVSGFRFQVKLKLNPKPANLATL